MTKTNNSRYYTIAVRLTKEEFDRFTRWRKKMKFNTSQGIRYLLAIIQERRNEKSI